jgi:hypothetical protein
VNIVFPKPFCSLEATGDPCIDDFASKFGKPQLVIKADRYIKKVKVLRGAPCGSTNYIAKGLWSTPSEEAELVAAHKLHNYPCNASTSTDPAVGDTSMHLASYQIKEAIKRAWDTPLNQQWWNWKSATVKNARKSALKAAPRYSLAWTP